MSKKLLPPCDATRDGVVHRLLEYLEACRVVQAMRGSDVASYWAKYVVLGIDRCIESLDIGIDLGKRERLRAIAEAIDKGMYSSVSDDEVFAILEDLCSELEARLKPRRSE